MHLLFLKNHSLYFKIATPGKEKIITHCDDNENKSSAFVYMALQRKTNQK